MTGTIHAVLDRLRDEALDERDKGSKFEQLIQAYLTTDPEWTARFSDVWLWSDWPGREGRPDTGIDLVATNADDGGLTAIQCKFYAADRTVAKADIDSFVSASAHSQFTRRIVFDTAAGWSANAEETLAGGVAQRVDIGYLADAAIDWTQFSWATPQIVVPTGKKALRPHQQKALDDVRAGLAEHDRGQLVMACGTGKTFTSLRIAEELVGAGGTVLFLVPSIQLLSQSLREWMANAEVDIRALAVCSDVKVGRRVASDDADQLPIDLTEPASTDPQTLLTRFEATTNADGRMRVVFSTYQSIDVVTRAQELGLPAFNLVICDEAHRTTGVTLAEGDESAFVRVHDADALKAAKRLYMTATPRVFGEEVRRKATDADAVLADMSDEDTFGPELHRLGFGQAVEADLLTDYKVLVLAVDEKYVAENFQQAMANSGEIQLDQAAKLIGCWNGLAKNFGSSATDGEAPLVSRTPMRTAVAFAQHIKASKTAAAAFPDLADRAQIDAPDDRPRLQVEAAHVDGTMGVHERNTHLAWLRAPAPDGVCRVLTNARCLSEGVDVPSLDAVLFLTPRGSQVDVVQSVGRVMRKAPGKELGYIVLPIVVPSGVAPEEALRDNERYKVVWQVLQALRSHDDRFHAMVNQIELNKRKPDTVEIVTITGPTDGDGVSVPHPDQPAKKSTEQLLMEFPADKFRDAMYARIVAKVGERRYWESWAKDIADIAAAHVTRIKGLLATPGPAAIEFEHFVAGLRGNLNDSITDDAAIDMLAQHLITRPVFEALFAHSSFLAGNPVARTMENMLAVLDAHAVGAENETLEGFYDTVRKRVAGVDNAAGKQRVLVELYDKFFATAFPKTVAKLGIVYTPVEIVDFILRSADEVLRAEFGQGLTDEGVHVLDPFTGTGTFLVRLLQSGLIEPHDLARKYANELHANEILLLAYYIAAANIETTFEELEGTPQPFPGLVLTDSFQSWENGDQQDIDVMPENNERLERQKQLPIQVIVGNPPYSVGQDSANDNNQNERYPTLDASIREAYMPDRARGGNNAMYDSYIRALRWASLRIQDRGIVGFVTNGGFLSANTADGMRKSLGKEFQRIYVLNLRGNGRVGGEEGRKEGRPLFEFGGWNPDGTEVKSSKGGSRATIAIVLLVKTDLRAGSALYYRQVDDYLTAGQKVRAVSAARSVLNMDGDLLEPNEHGDWLDGRSSGYEQFIPLGAKHGADFGGATVFQLYGRGLETGRDAWVYSSSARGVSANVEATVKAYGQELARLLPLTAEVRSSERKWIVDANVNTDPTYISWTLSLKSRLIAGRTVDFEPRRVGTATYRPFFKQRVYFDAALNHIRGQVPRFFPAPGHRNLGFYQVGHGSAVPFSVLAADVIPDLHVTGAGSGGQFFGRWRYERVDDSGMFDVHEGEVVDGYRRIDNITDEALAAFSAAYPDESLSKDDIFDYVYGLLHSPEYRESYAADLKKMLPRIPFAADFRAFASAGKQLAEVHLDYETVKPYPLEGLDVDGPGGDADYGFFAVGSKKMSFGKATAEQKVEGLRSDRSVIHYNERITLRGIPEEAYRYTLGSRSAIEWIIDRYWVKTDKASGIVNDPNDWSREVGDPRYILDLLGRIVTVSLETMRIVDSLPALDIKAAA
ncbi:DEAD/DEAH box helicase [Blastococcus saxobsidens]|uniref:Putative helicase n=1 Tax=Blastococcus saxobsidens TaxID=138336 RepID=A0A4Q7Y427_9ACTN|nr:type ISP restriction/modification enzyme [Blastococcus saxobsidens]RZU31338.1 putative helicase [Blastococcus saxobsidens]